MLEPSRPPEGSVAVLTEELSRQVATNSFGRQVGRYVRPEQMTATAAHPVFVLGLRDVVDGIDLPRGTEDAWRYLVEVDKEVVAAAEIQFQDDEHTFGHVNVGPFVDGTVAALRVADADPDGSYTAAVIHIPAVHTMLLWMRATESRDAEDRIVPISPSPLAPDRTYRVDELAGELSRLARRTSAEAASDPAIGG